MKYTSIEREVLKMRTSKETIDYILALAKKQRISRRELAKKVGVSESAISRYANYSREFPTTFA